jgi:hypothetical protein
MNSNSYFLCGCGVHYTSKDVKCDKCQKERDWFCTICGNWYIPNYPQKKHLITIQHQKSLKIKENRKKNFISLFSYFEGETYEIEIDSSKTILQLKKFLIFSSKSNKMEFETNEIVLKQSEYSNFVVVSLKKKEDCQDNDVIKNHFEDYDFFHLKIVVKNEFYNENEEIEDLGYFSFIFKFFKKNDYQKKIN